MLRKIWFQAHWIVGITLGAILCFSGVTGGLMAFGPELTDYFSGGSETIYSVDDAPLSAAALYQRIHDANPSRRIVDLTTYADAHRPAMVHFDVPAGFIGPTAPIAETRMVDPYTGKLMPARPFGHAVERFMHWLHEVHQGHWGPPGAKLPDIGATLVGLGSVFLFFMAFTGLYLRWPRGKAARNWRSWFKIQTRLKGRAFLWNLHSVIGTCVLLAYLVSAHSGAFQNGEMGWYGSGVRAVLGLPAEQRGGGGPPGGVPGGPGGPPGAGGPGPGAGGPGGPPGGGMALSHTVQLIAMPSNGFVDADGDQVNATISILDTNTGMVTAQPADPAPKSFAEALAANNQLIHEGRIWGRTGTALIGTAALCMPVFYISGWMMYLHRRRRKARAASPDAAASEAAAS